ncbi:MAG: alpha/beta hydrolase [Bacteroidales bacterium]|nr:MAG: alpha/beta hydrolase [Bacteroidales bacterium]
MTGIVKFENISIRYKLEGMGTVVVLLHGYLESLDIWSAFSGELMKKFRVISIDLPGHGQSGIIADAHTMEIMAEAVKAVISELNISKCILIGHSLGGYVTMAFADLFPDRLYGYSLFHSTPFRDTEDKKQNRNREIELVDQGKKEMIFNTNVPRAFADDNLKKLKRKVEQALQIARNTTDEGIKAVLEGMKLRIDRSEVLSNSKIPVLVILGRKDNYIPYELVKERIKLNDKGEIYVLENAGHMGFIEEIEESLKAVTSFVKRCTG